ncbi:ead/Ea22-like family protein [Citrobacter portucalensis]|uniref:ead/Ea22-like family protein n=1 Tax=Citrobacter portucalensis TaxID=1639133 RepID=UPI00300D8361
MTIDKQALRQLATDAHELGIIKRYTKGIEANKRFVAIVTPLTVLALLDELEAAEKRIAELSASHSKLREGMAAIYNAICENGASTSLSAILTFVKRSREESATAAGIGVKGE